MLENQEWARGQSKGPEKKAREKHETSGSGKKKKKKKKKTYRNYLNLSKRIMRKRTKAGSLRTP